MPNIATVLKAEITRLARKEVRDETDGLRKTAAAQRAEIASLKRRLAAIESLVKRLTKGPGRAARETAAPAPASADDAGDGSRRFSAKGLATSRKKLGLSAADFALLVGTTGQSIYAWEAGKSRPRPQALNAIVALRGVGKREIAQRLAGLKG